FLLDVLDNLPRLRLSSAHLKMILFMMRNINPKDVPSYRSLREEQARLKNLCGVPTIQYQSQQGDIYYLNDVVDMMKKNFENPETASHIMIYPEDTESFPSEFTQFARIREHPEQLTPSFQQNNKRFYIDELALLYDGRMVIPLIWVLVKGEVHAYCQMVTISTTGLVIEDGDIQIPAKELDMNFPELIAKTQGLQFAAQFASFASAMPNKYREIDKDEDHFVVWMPVWADDVSGARSKQYQKHVNVYMCNGSLPGKLVQQEYHVIFVGSSPQVSATEMLGSVMKQVESTHANPARCYNAATGHFCRFRLQVPYLPADNPQQSEECSHIGHLGSYPCRICHVGGPYTEKESNEGYEAFYNVGTPRSSTETWDAIFQQICLASRGIASHVEKVKTESGTADKTAQYWINILLSKSSDLKKKDPKRLVDDISVELLLWLVTQTTQPYNPLLDSQYLDPCKDSPIENLHTYLLGHEKYAWYAMHTSWNESTQALFTVRLQSTDINGLNIPPIRSAYVMQYRNGLIRKHFKTLMQTSIFHIQDIVSEHQFTLAKAIGELGAVLWITEIDNLDQYLEDLEVLIDNVLDAWALMDPRKILVKIKLHLIKHLPAHIQRFGLSVRFSTEVFECFNAVFRMCSVLSNHQAPSRDIALKNGEMCRVKHILSGGCWLQNGRVTRAGEGITSFFKSTPILHRHLGWVPPRHLQPGSVRCPGRDKRLVLAGAATKAFAAVTCGVPGLAPDSSWIVASHVVSQSEDVCPVGSWVIVRFPNRHFIARIIEILHPSAPEKNLLDLVTVEEFALGEALHHYYGMPILYNPQQHLVIASGTIQFIINVQHDCRAAGCSPTGSYRQRQERIESNRQLSCIKHVDNSERYIINTHALHNASRIRRYLPRYLTVPRQLICDQKTWHIEIATTLRASQNFKRAERKEKNAMTREKNKEKAEAAQRGHSENVHIHIASNEERSTARKRHHRELEMGSMSDLGGDMEMDSELA
ncbi:hypothetical protein F5050DRAFT_1580171, partial [Lentinula boryana]